MQAMNTDQVRELLKAACQKPMTQRAVAKHLGVFPSYICDVLKGNRLPGPKILRYLGLERSFDYQPTNGSDTLPD